MASSKKHVRFNDENIFYSPHSSPTLSDSSLPSSGDSSGPSTPPQNNYAGLPLPDGPVGIHPILAFHPQIPPIVYDASLLPHTITFNTHASAFSPPARVLDDPATQPSLHIMTLLINVDHFPWRLTIPPMKHYVSVRDLMDALYCFLRHPVLSSEYNTMPTQALKDEVSIAFHSRCARAPSLEAAREQRQKGLKRVDFLRGRTRFMGLYSTKIGPEVWALNFA